MKIMRIVLALAIGAAGLAASQSFADDNDDPKCNCWYWNSNQKGVIVTTTGPNGEKVEDCKVQSCAGEMQ